MGIFKKIKNTWNNTADWVDDNVTFSFLDDPKKHSPSDMDKLASQQQTDSLINQVNEIDPYTINWDEGKVYDSEGNLVKDYSEYYSQIADAQATNIPSLDEYMQDKGYSFNEPMATDEFGNYINPTMQNIDQLTEDFRSGPSEAELAESDAYAARQLGMTVEEYQARMDDLSVAMEGGISEMEGMSEEERELRERANRNDLREMEIRAERQIENIQANTGSASRSLAAADEAMRSINDAQIQQQVALADETFRRQTMEYEAQQQQWQQMVKSGQMARSEYLQLVQNSKAQAFKGYALQIDTMFQQNQDYLQRYQSDLKSVAMALDNTYKAINAEMGVDTAMMDYVEQQYNREIAPLLNEIDLNLQQQELQAAQDAAENDFLDYFTAAISFVALFV